MRALPVVFSLVVVACGSKKDKPPPASGDSGKIVADATAVIAADAAVGGADCADRAARLTKRLQELAAATPGFMPIAGDIKAPDSAAGKPFDARGFVVGIAKDGKAFVQGQRFDKMKDVEQYLDAMNKNALEKFILNGGDSKDAKFPVYVWADRDVPVATLNEVLASAQAAGSRWVIRLVVTGKAEPPRDTNLSPEVTAIASKLPASEPDGTKYLADQLRAAIGQCEGIITPLATADLGGTPDKITEQLAKEVPAGLVKCECKIPNADVFEWGMHVWFGSTAPALAWIEMPKVTKGDKQPLGKLVK